MPALRTLWLGPDENEMKELGLGQPWVTDVLRNAPPSLRTLLVSGRVGEGSPAAEAIVSLTQLRALSMESVLRHNEGEEVGEEFGTVPPLSSGPLWRGLEALQWHNTAPLPWVRVQRQWVPAPRMCAQSLMSGRVSLDLPLSVSEALRPCPVLPHPAGVARRHSTYPTGVWILRLPVCARLPRPHSN